MVQLDPFNELRDYVQKIKIIDTHEHLIQENERTGKNVDLLSTFFIFYASTDLRSAGMPEHDLYNLWDSSKPLEDRWTLFEPYWEKIRNTAYARVIEIAVRDLYGINNIDSKTYKEISKRMQERNEAGLYHWILKEQSGIDLSILDMGVYDVDRNFFAPVIEFNDLLAVSDRTSLENLGRIEGGPIHTLDDLVYTMKLKFNRFSDRIVGVKIPLAYRRPIFFEKTSFSSAEEAFNKIYKVKLFKRIDFPNLGMKMIPGDVDLEDLKPLQDYLVHKIIQEAEKRKLPIQIHTGIQEGNENIISHSNPVHLVNLFMEYKDVNFDIFHGAWPYCDELGALAKSFPNVYIDMCVMHIISPSRSRLALSNWLDEVPANKIFGFGGDYLFVEGVYGHSVIAKENIVKVLASKVEEGAFRLKEAKKYASWLLRDNPLRFFP